MKKIFIISSIALTAVLVFFGVYKLVFDNKKEENNSNILLEEKEENNDNNLAEKQSKNDIIIKISKEPVLSPVLSRSQENIWYFSKKAGNIKQISLSGPVKRTVAVSRDNIQGIRNIKWAPNKEKVLYARGNGQFLYDLKKIKEQELKKGLDMAVWTNLGDRIVYKYYDDKIGQRTLNIANPDGSEWKKLTDLNNVFRKMEIEFVPQSNFISYWNSPDAFIETSFNLVSLFHGWNKEIVNGLYGADYLWSPDGNKLFVSFLSNEKGNHMGIGIYDNYGKQLVKMKFPTLASKCVWSNDNVHIYCAFISNIPETATMPNDYYQKKFATKDSFWQIDIKTGRQERIVESKDIKEEYDATNLFLSADESFLFFVNRRNDFLYRITL